MFNVDLYKEKFGFDAKDGFLGKDMSCKLPRKYRSVRCQGFLCEKARKSLTKDAINKLEEIDSHMRYAREQEGMPI